MSGTVPATLSLIVGAGASLGSFTPGVNRDYEATPSANVIPTGGDAALSVADTSTNAPGRLVNGAFALPQALQVKASSLAGGPGFGFAPLPGTASTPLPLLNYTGPTSNDAVTVGLKQPIGANDRCGRARTARR